MHTLKRLKINKSHASSDYYYYWQKLRNFVASLIKTVSSSLLNREVDPETGCMTMQTHHPRIQQEPSLQRMTNAGLQPLTMASDHTADDPTADDPVPSEPAADGTWLVTTVLCGYNGSTVVAWWPTVQRPQATCDAGDAKKHTHHCTSSRKTRSQTCKCISIRSANIIFTQAFNPLTSC